MKWEKNADGKVKAKVLHLRDKRDDDFWGVLVLSRPGPDTFRPSLSRPGRAGPN